MGCNLNNEIIIQNKNKLFFKTTKSTRNIFICIHAYLCFSLISKALFRRRRDQITRNIL